MIIDHLNTGLRGGAAIAARRIHESLRAAGAESRFWYSRREGPPPPDESYGQIIWPDERGFSPLRLADRALGRVKRTRLKRTRKKALAGRPSGLDLFSDPRTGWKTSFDSRNPFGTGGRRGDILHLHWIAHSIDYPTFFASLPSNLPIVWTLHDMNPFTGGCHYTTGCRAFETECSHCPQLGWRGEHDLSSEIFHLKRQAMEDKNLHIVADSQWIESQAKSSAILAGAKSFQTIHYGLEVQALIPQDRLKSRNEFELPDDAIVVGFGADSVENHRKGFRELLKAFAQLRTKKRVIGLMFGSGDAMALGESSLEIRSVGFIKDLAKQSQMYSAMDLFVMPSLEEAFGMTGLEAMACGVPVVAFASGGITDYVRPHKTGSLVPVGDVPQLALEIDQMIENPAQRHSRGKSAREMVVQEFSSERKAQDYLRLYGNLLSD